jgi:hypothetical protein
MSFIICTPNIIRVTKLKTRGLGSTQEMHTKFIQNFNLNIGSEEAKQENDLRFPGGESGFDPKPWKFLNGGTL